MAPATFSWCFGLDNRFASDGFVRKPVSMRIEGMSGDFRTRKPACSTRRLCRFPIRPSDLSTWLPTSALALRVAVCCRSTSTEASRLSLSSIETPPTKSDAFSCFASHRAASLLAPLCERT